MEALAALERRRAARVPVHVELDFSNQHNFYSGLVEDLSVGGLFVATYSLHEVGTEIDLSFALPSGDEIEVCGRVRWLRDPHDLEDPDAHPGMGIEFVGLRQEDHAAIRTFVEEHGSLLYDDVEV